MSVDAAMGSDTPFDARIHELRGHAGQIAMPRRSTARCSRAARSAHSHLTGDDKVQDPYSLRCQPQVMGACLDVMRDAARTLLIEANGVTDNPLVFPETGEVALGRQLPRRAGGVRRRPRSRSRIAEIGALSERRIALLIDATMTGLPPFLASASGVNSGFMIAHVTAAALASENKSLAHPASVDSLPTSANQEDHVSHGDLRRAPPGRHGGQHRGASSRSSSSPPRRASTSAARCAPRAPLEEAHALIRTVAPHLDGDRYLALDIEAVTPLVRGGAFRQIRT